MAYLDQAEKNGVTYDLTDTKGRAMIAPKEASSTASMAHATGTYFTYNDLLYQATSDIAVGGTITPNTNCKAVALGSDVSDLKSDVSNLEYAVDKSIGVATFPIFAWQIKKGITNTGAIETYNSFALSDYIDVKKGDKIVYSGTFLDGNNVPYACLLGIYDASKNFIERVYILEDSTVSRCSIVQNGFIRVMFGRKSSTQIEIKDDETNKCHLSIFSYLAPTVDSPILASNWQLGYGINSIGYVSLSPTYALTDYIQVRAGDTIFYNGDTVDDNNVPFICNVAVYNAEGNILGRPQLLGKDGMNVPYTIQYDGYIRIMFGRAASTEIPISSGDLEKFGMGYSIEKVKAIEQTIDEIENTLSGLEKSIIAGLDNVSGATVSYDANNGYTISLVPGSSAVNTWVSVPFTINAGQVAVVEFYGKANHIEPSSSTGAGVIVEFFKADGTKVGEKYNGFILSKNRFGYHRYGYVAPWGIQTGKIRLFTRANTTASIRNIKLQVMDIYPQRQRCGILYDGHLGMIYAAPRNTMPALELGKVAGFNTMIVNVRATADNVLVCIHDSTINATSDGTGAVSSYTYEQLLQFDFGSWFDSAYAGTKIPTFEEAAKYLAATGIGIGVSIHPDALSDQNIADMCAIYKRYGNNGKSFVKSFDSSVLTKVYAILGDSVGYVYDCDTATTAKIDFASDFPTECTIEMYTGTATDALINYAHSKGVPVSIFFGNDMLAVRDYINKGVTRFCIDTFADIVFPNDAVDNS